MSPIVVFVSSLVDNLSVAPELGACQVFFTKRRILLIQEDCRISQTRLKITAILVIKNLFDAQSEEPSGPEGERQAQIETARLDGVDGLPDHIKGIGQPACSRARRAAA
jgi:hypothetical protein